MKNRLFYCFLGLFLFPIFLSAKALDDDKKATLEKGAKIVEGYGGLSTFINANHIASYVDWQGISAYNQATGSSGTTFPRGEVGVVYRDGLVWGGLVRDGIIPAKRVGGNTYVVGTQPGKIIGGMPEDWEAQLDGNGVIRVYRIRNDFQTVSDSVMAADAADLFNMDIAEVSSTEIQTIREQYGLDWKEWPADRGAPYYDIDGSGSYNPVLDENGWPVLPEYDTDGNLIAGGDYPGFQNGDQVIWYVINDLNYGRTTVLYGSPPIGLEVQITYWAYQNTPGLSNTFFKRYQIYNKSGATIDSMYLAQWSDPDVGDYSDDFVGCDPDLGLAYAYNGVEWDDKYLVYGLAPAAVGYQLLLGPAVPSPGDSAFVDNAYVNNFKNLPMTSFAYFTAGGQPSTDPLLGDYDGTLQWYNILRGYLPTATEEPLVPYTTNDGTPTFFPLSGDPLTHSGDVDGWEEGPGDRRMVMSCGPFDMSPEDMKEIWVAVIGGQGETNLESISVLKENAMLVQSIIPDFRIKSEKPIIELYANPDNENLSIDLNWTNVEDWYDNPSYHFIGYNIYQVDNTDDSRVKIANFDVVDGVSQINDLVGGSVETVYNGQENGTQTSLTISTDAIGGGPLIIGKKYTFSARAYVYNPSAPDGQKVLASDFSVVDVRILPDNYVPLFPAIHTSGTSEKEIQVYVTDPALMNNNDYLLTVTLDEEDNSIAKLENLSTEVVIDSILVLEDKIDTLRFPLLGFDLVIDNNQTPTWTDEGNRWVSGTNFGGPLLFGGGFAGIDFFGSTIDYDHLWSCEMDFQDSADVIANGYASKGVVYDRDEGYIADGLGDIPFSAYDMSDPANPRKVNICFTEDDRYAPSNHRWDMGWNDTTQTFASEGGREYLFIMNSDYNEATGGGYDDTNWGPQADVVWGIGPASRGSHPYLEAEFTLNFVVNKAIGTNGPDTYWFRASLTDIDEGENELKATQFALKPNYPNPFNPSTNIVFEIEKAGRAKLDIFNILGQKVATLYDGIIASGPHTIRWDASTMSSGMYFTRLQANGKTAIRKMMLLK